MGTRASWLVAVIWAVALPAWADQHVVIVLDDSGSMDQPLRKDGRTRKIDAAKTALRTVLENLPDDSQVGLVVLNGDQDWLIPLGPVDRSDLDRMLRRIRAQGGTPLGKYLKVAADELLAARERQRYGTYKLLVVTDGEAADQELVEQYLPDILTRGVMVDVIGVDMQQAHSLATKVQTYRRADDPQSLQQAISDVVLGETTADAADAGESDFALLSGFPDAAATAALDALAQPTNHPIGARAATPGPATAVSGTAVAQAPPAAAPQAVPGFAPERPAASPVPRNGSSFLSVLLSMCCVGFVAVIVVLGVGVALVLKK